MTIAGTELNNVRAILGVMTLGLGYTCGGGASALLATSSTPESSAGDTCPAASLVLDKVVILDADGEDPAQIYGKIDVAGQTLFDRFSSNFVEIGVDHSLPITRIPLRTNGAYKFSVLLHDYDASSPDDEVANGTFVWDPATGDLGTHTQTVYGTYGRVNVSYRVAPYWYKLHIDSVKYTNASADNPGQIYGDIIVYSGGEEQYIFSRAHHGYQEISQGGYLSIESKSMKFGVDAGIYVMLWDYDQSSADDEVASGYIYWAPNHTLGNHVTTVTGGDGAVEITYTVETTPLIQ